jgi:hypothetical protein
MSNFAQERFDLGVEAAYLLNEARDIAQHTGPDIEEQYAHRANEVPGTDMSLRTLNRLYVRHGDAWANYHIFKSIADTIFATFIPETGRDYSKSEYEEEVTRLMSGVNGFPERISYPFIEESIS